MDLKVVGVGCDKCDTLYANTQEALRLTGAEATLEKVEDLIEMVRLGVMTSPVLLIDGKIAINARVASAKEIADLLRKHSSV